MAITVNLVTTPAEMELCLAIRRTVFIEEQLVPEVIEIDEFENTSTHVLGKINGIPAGTARWRITDTGTKLERFAVLSDFRRQGVGAALLANILNQIDLSNTVYLNSQDSAIEFYRRYNFFPAGEIFYEANIVHQRMELG